MYFIYKLEEPNNIITTNHMENAAGTIQHEWAGREGKSSLLFFVHLNRKRWTNLSGSIIC